MNDADFCRKRNLKLGSLYRKVVISIDERETQRNGGYPLQDLQQKGNISIYDEGRFLVLFC